MGFPTQNDHFGVFRGYHHLRKHPYIYISFNITYWVDQILAPTGMSLVHKQKVANKPRKIKIILDFAHNF